LILSNFHLICSLQTSSAVHQTKPLRMFIATSKHIHERSRPSIWVAIP